MLKPDIQVAWKEDKTLQPGQKNMSQTYNAEVIWSNKSSSM
jgi:hypothetical protein